MGEESLRWHFEQYGPVLSVEVMRDRNTGQPRGFAFVVFTDASTVDLVMNEDKHEINHKIVDVKRAQARGVAPPSIHGGDKPQHSDRNEKQAIPPAAAVVVASRAIRHRNHYITKYLLAESLLMWIVMDYVRFLNSLDPLWMLSLWWIKRHRGRGALVLLLSKMARRVRKSLSKHNHSTFRAATWKSN